MALDTETLGSLRIERSNATSAAATARGAVTRPSRSSSSSVAAGALVLRRQDHRSHDGRRGSGVRGPSLGNSVLNASGYVVARRMSTVSSKVTGKIAEIYVEEGMAVEKGQVLARLDPINSQTMLTMAERELEASRRNLAEIEVRLADAQRNLERNEAARQAAARQPDRARYLARRSQRAGRAPRSLAGAGQGRRERPADAAHRLQRSRSARAVRRRRHFEGRAARRNDLADVEAAASRARASRPSSTWTRAKSKWTSTSRTSIA